MIFSFVNWSYLTDGPSLPMRSIISRDFHGKFIMLEDDARVPFQVGVDQASSAQFGVMEIVEKYSEKYLLTHALVNGTYDSCV